jgi:hypothetical protein
MRASRILFRFTVVAGALMLVLLVVLFLIPDAETKPSPPLPFGTNGLVATTTYEIFPSHLPPHPSLKDRLVFAYVKLWLRYDPSRPNPTNWSFAASPVALCSIQGLLNQCNQASGVRYLMPIGVAVGGVQFGNSNALSGARWIASFEAALQSNTPDLWDAQTKRTHGENLVLIRYPEQRTVLVLPASEAIEFRRTNQTGVMDPPGH